MVNEIFNYDKNKYGGTEYVARTFKQKVLPYLPKLNNYNCLIMPGITPTLKELQTSNKEIILWIHNTFYQFNEEAIKQFFIPSLVDKIKYFIAPSETSKKLLLEVVDINPDNVCVIPNALAPLEYKADKFKDIKQLKLIHTSSSDRGLDVLLNSLTLIDADFRLEIYNDFNPDLIESMPEKFDNRIRFYGKTPKATVKEAYENSHIHAYPSTYPETFCLSQVEAMSAGLYCVTSDLGSLPEVSGGHTQMYPHIEDRIEHYKVFAKELTKAIETVMSGNWNPEEQIAYANSEYSWERHKQRWLELHEKL